MEMISIILPTFNRAHCLGRALAGIRAQNYPSLELCVGDDASTDGTVEVVKKEFPSARIAVLPENRGAAAARNAAAALATGEFLAFLDSDDEWLPGKLEKQMAFLREHPEVALVGCGHIFVRLDGREEECPGWNPPDWKRHLQSAQSFHGASTPLVRRAAWEETGGQDERMRVLEDWDWMLRLAAVDGIHVLPDLLVRIHENRPSNPEATLAATKIFLQKHDQDFARYGTRHRREVISQHQENAARIFIRHGRNREAGTLLFSSLTSAPWRNAKVAAALLLAWVDSLLGTHLLAGLLEKKPGTTGSLAKKEPAG